jgi:hypothetical protein
MANTTVSIRERSKTADGRWRSSAKIMVPEGKLNADAERRGKFYLVWTENGKKKETKVEAKTFESALNQGCSCEGTASFPVLIQPARLLGPGGISGAA